MRKLASILVFSALAASLGLTACTSAGSGSSSQATASVTTTEAATESETAQEETVANKLSSINIEIPTVKAANETVPKVSLATLAALDFDWYDEIKKYAPDDSNFTTDDRGAIAMDATVLFDVDSSTLSDKGKEELKTFFDAYAKAVKNDDGSLKVKKITVEGHTDTDGEYDYNLKLSEERAKSVMDYCNEIHPEFKDILTSKGCSYDYPVKKADGSVDKAASRRVCFVAE
ncbi:MAG: OmpA family protein [Ruminococcus sp.]|nr:OmpA family protein [Ruminococcus sp.]